MKNKLTIGAALAFTALMASTNPVAGQETETTVTYSSETIEDELRRGEVGLRFLPTFSAMDFNASGDGNGNGPRAVSGELTLNYGFGLMLGFNITRYVGLQAEVNYNMISQKYTDRNLERQVDLSYIDIPVMLSLFTNKAKPVHFNVVLGPQFGFNVGSDLQTSGGSDTSTVRAVLAVKESDVGFAYGAGVGFLLNEAKTLRIDIGYRGFFGLVDIDAATTGENSYNVLVKAGRESHGAYAGLTFAF